MSGNVGFPYMIHIAAKNLTIGGKPRSSYNLVCFSCGISQAKQNTRLSSFLPHFNFTTHHYTIISTFFLKTKGTILIDMKIAVQDFGFEVDTVGHIGKE